MALHNSERMPNSYNAQFIYHYVTQKLYIKTICVTLTIISLFWHC